MIIRHREKEYNTHKYRDLSWLVGESVEVRTCDLFQQELPDRVVVIAEYPKTLLLELTFNNKCKYKRMVTKAQMYCGDVFIKHRESDIAFVGSEVLESHEQ